MNNKIKTVLDKFSNNSRADIFSPTRRLFSRTSPTTSSNVASRNNPRIVPPPGNNAAPRPGAPVRPVTRPGAPSSISRPPITNGRPQQPVFPGQQQSNANDNGPILVAPVDQPPRVFPGGRQNLPLNGRLNLPLNPQPQGIPMQQPQIGGEIEYSPQNIGKKKKQARPLPTVNNAPPLPNYKQSYYGQK